MALTSTIITSVTQVVLQLLALPVIYTSAYSCNVSSTLYSYRTRWGTFGGKGYMLLKFTNTANFSTFCSESECFAVVELFCR